MTTTQHHGSSSYQVKAFTLRAMGEVLTKHSKLAAVARLLDPRVRELLVTPPPSSSWIDGLDLVLIEEAIIKLEGEPYLRKVLKDSVTLGIMNVLRPVVEGITRLFGTSPTVFLEKLPMISQSNSRGSTMECIRKGDRRYILRNRIAGIPNVGKACFIGFAGSVEVIFEICHTNGVVADPVVRKEGNDTVADVEVSW